MKRILPISLWSLATVFSTLVNSESSVFEKAPVVISSWVQEQEAPTSAFLDLHLVLQHPRSGELEQHVLDISTPGHASHGQFLSREQLKQYLQPSQQALDEVKDWLNDNMIREECYNTVYYPDVIHMNITVAEAQLLFNTTFYTFTRNGQSVIRAREYSLPNQLHQHVKTVVPIVRFPHIAAQRSMILDATTLPQLPPSLEYDPEYCNHTITPACLQGLYQLNNFTAPLNTGVTFGIAGFLGQTLLVDDLHNFIARWAPYAPQPFPTLVAIFMGILGDPKTATRKDTSEASLDFQYAAAIAPGIPLTFYSIPGLGPSFNDRDQPSPATVQNEPYFSQLTYLLALPDDNLPSVISYSYGENEQSVPESYANSTCYMFGQLAARGVSIIFGSGDEGAGSACTKNDGTNATTFDPIYPATCPYVTSVGGTYGVEPEIAAAFSSGGFSRYFVRPAYQDSAVNAYLDTIGDKFQGLYEPTGRGFPDISAQSEQFVITDHGDTLGVAGTSASAPVFAGMIANLNALRVSRGLSTMGWLNPWLYGNGSRGFTDITEGGSIGCTGRSIISGLESNYIPYASWNATKGWDPVSGLGTPMWPRLVEEALPPNWSQPDPPSLPAIVGLLEKNVSSVQTEGDETAVAGRVRGLSREAVRQDGDAS